MTTQPDSYIRVQEAAERRQHRLWSLGLLGVVLHLAYFAFPFLPWAGAQAWWPWLALLPPLFAGGYALVLLRLLRRWRRARATNHAFMAIPPHAETPS